MICPRCGGSGIQRVADQRFRTCQDCLGQGVILVSGSVSPEPETSRSGSDRDVEVSAAASSFVAR